MDRLIKVYDDILDAQTCDNLVDKFEQFENQHESFDVRGMIFTQLNMAKSPQIWNTEIEKFTDIFEKTHLKDYVKKCLVIKQCLVQSLRTHIFEIDVPFLNISQH